MTERIDWPAHVAQWIEVLHKHLHCDNDLVNLEADMAGLLTEHEEIESGYRSPVTSQGTLELLRRNGYQPTGNWEEDKLIAAEILPKRRML